MGSETSPSWDCGAWALRLIEGISCNSRLRHGEGGWRRVAYINTRGGMIQVHVDSSLRLFILRSGFVSLAAASFAIFTWRGSGGDDRLWFRRRAGARVEKKRGRTAVKPALRHPTSPSPPSSPSHPSQPSPWRLTSLSMSPASQQPNDALSICLSRMAHTGCVLKPQLDDHCLVQKQIDLWQCFKMHLGMARYMAPRSLRHRVNTNMIWSGEQISNNGLELIWKPNSY